MLPPYYDGKYFPPGDHVATWQDILDRFSTGQTRQALCGRLRVFLDHAKRCGFIRVYIFGSFISAKGDPGDIDLLWVYREDLDLDTLSRDCRDLLNYEVMRIRERWDMFCCSDNAFVINYLLEGWRKSRPPESCARGVIMIELVDL